MQEPRMLDTHHSAPDTETLVSYMPVPGFGVIPINSFLIRSKQPVLVDTGLAPLRDSWFEMLSSRIDLDDIRWIWITHTDPDHVGNLKELLERAPQARLVTTYLGMGKLGMLGIPVDRVYLLNPEQKLDVGDRELVAFAPPSFDAPETTGLYDGSTRTLFSADCFGALMEEPAEDAAEISREALSQGIRGWAVVDAPWLTMVDPQRFDAALRNVRDIGAETVLSSHLPAARGMTERLVTELRAARETPSFTGPDQAALEEMMGAVPA